MPIAQVPSLEFSTEQHDNFAYETLNISRRTVVKSGKRITIRTDNPIQRPLSDVRFLDMLQRLRAIRGRAEPETDDCFDDDDEESEA
jgi:hypothetical protein